MIMQKEKIPGIISLVILTAITLVCWAFFDIYRVIKKSPPVVVPPEITATFNADLDTAALETVGKRYYVEEMEIKEPARAPTELPETSPASTAPALTTPLATSSATPSATPL